MITRSSLTARSSWTSLSASENDSHRRQMILAVWRDDLVVLVVAIVVVVGWLGCLVGVTAAHRHTHVSVTQSVS